MTARHYRKPHRYKRKKPLLKQRFFWLGILILMAIGGISYFLFFSDFFRIKNIQITGNEKVLSEDVEKTIREEMAAEYGNNIFFFGDLKIKNTLLGVFPKIAELDIKKSLPGTLKVGISERQALALWCETLQNFAGQNLDGQGKNCFLLDKEGVIFALPAEASAEEGRAPADSGLIVVESGQPALELFLGKAVMTKDKLVQVLAIENKIAEASDLFIKKAVLVSDERLDIETIEGWTIRFNLKSDLDWQVTELKLALEKQISPAKRKSLEYIDLRFSRVYYK